MELEKIDEIKALIKKDFWENKINNSLKGWDSYNTQRDLCFKAIDFSIETLLKDEGVISAINKAKGKK